MLKEVVQPISFQLLPCKSGIGREQNRAHFMLTNKLQWVGMDDFPMTQTFSYRTRAWDNVGLGLTFITTERIFQRMGFQATFAYHIPLRCRSLLFQKVSLDRQLSFGVSLQNELF